MIQASQGKGPSLALRTAMPDPLRAGRRIPKSGFGPGFMGFPSSTFFSNCLFCSAVTVLWELDSES